MTSTIWGGRFSKPSNSLLIEFNESLSVDYQLYKYDILGSIAHSQMLAKQGLITKEESETIEYALNQISKEIENDQIDFDKKFEDIHMLVEHHLIKKIGEIGKKLHTGRSRNDQVQVDVRLYIRDESEIIMDLLKTLIEVLGELQNKYSQVTMPGYTHLQQAQPLNVGTYHEAYKHMFGRDLERFQDWHKRMNFSPLGAAALTGSTLPLDREYVAKLLNFQGIIHNTVDAISDRDYLIEFLSCSSIVMIHLSRLCEDIILWCTTEFNFITLDDAFATGSSMMPHKKNPDVAELMRGKSGRVIGNLTAMLTLLKGLPISYAKDLQEDKELLFDTVKTLKLCLKIIGPYLSSLKYNTDVMEKAASSSFLQTTSMMEQLVITGMPLRDAHRTIGEMVHQSVNSGTPLSEIWTNFKKKRKTF